MFCDNREIPVSGAKQKALLAYLALQDGRPVARELLADLLWGDRFEQQARRSLRQALFRLKQSLSEAGTNILALSDDSVALVMDNLAVDALIFQATAEDPAVADATALVPQHRQLLDGLTVANASYEEWLGSERTRLSELAANLYDRFVAAHMTTQPQAALAAADAWIALDPLNEAAHRRGMEIELGRGERAAALQRFNALSGELQRELGIDPGPEAQALAASTRDGASVAAKQLALPDKPSIVVLPFINISGDQEQEYFADGITEDITTALSRISGLFVIARNSAFTYKEKTIEVRQIGHELGVRYILEGSVRKAGNRLRITGQLVDAETGTNLWADKFDSTLEDVFELQDLVTASVAGAIEPSVTQAEIERASQKPTGNLQAYDYLLKALGASALYTPDATDRAIRLARRGLELDPNYAQAYAFIASWHCARRTFGWMENEAEETGEGIRFAYLAAQLQPNDPTVLTRAAFALGHLNRDLETAIPWFDRALALNPNSAMAYGRGAVVRNFAGDYETAAIHGDRAIRLSPFDTFIFAFSLARGVSHLFRRQLTDAISWLRKAAQENPLHSSTFLSLASALAHAGELAAARTALERFLEMRPMSSATWQRQRRLYPKDDYEFLLEGARKAGLPE